MTVSTIYREQAIEVADAIWVVTGDKNVAKVWQQLQDLPSAEKTGKWLDIGKFTDIEGSYHEVWKCNCCGYISYDNSNYCPICGVEMVNEVEE